MTCGAMSCPTGCCVGGRCLTTTLQDNSLCGFFGDQCRACAFNEGCVGGKCIPLTNFDAGTAVVGGPCRADPDCGNDGQWFCIPENSGGQPTGFTGGYCSRMCDNAPCPNGTCIQAETSDGNIINICLASCMTATDCRSTYICDQSVCLPP